MAIFQWVNPTEQIDFLFNCMCSYMVHYNIISCNIVCFTVHPAMDPWVQSLFYSPSILALCSCVLLCVLYVYELACTSFCLCASINGTVPQVIPSSCCKILVETALPIKEKNLFSINIFNLAEFSSTLQTVYSLTFTDWLYISKQKPILWWKAVWGSLVE